MKKIRDAIDKIPRVMYTGIIKITREDAEFY